MKKLDFIGIGVQKAATSWLFQCLLEHPEIKVGKEKEVNFFNFKYHFGYHWYHNLFQFGDWKTGEFSTLYFYDKNVPERLYSYNPDIKLILCLRNPIDRAYSQHQHEVRRGRVTGELLNFDLAVESNPTYIDQGYYASHLKSYLKYFKKEQIFITFQEDISSNPDKVLVDLYRFLNLDDKFIPSTINTKINIARTYKSRRLDKTYRFIKGMIHKYANEENVEKIKKLGLHKLIEKFNAKEQTPITTPPMTTDARTKLESIFISEIKDLEKLTERNLSNWYRNINN
ncbi:MAG: sulfotransferase domain-containing protein [Gammaproteobacteria bacterium]|nr:sulfotransferase domain-containing protein [Gammaproteobacteria bacterium]